MLLGRERERQAIDGVLAGAREGRSAVLALIGEPGIGKTALLDDAAARTEGLTVLRARGIESEAHVPFAGLFELLRPLLPLIDRIPRPQAAALESALALRPAVSGERFAVAAATLSLFGAAADTTPVVMLVDDAHLLDAATAEALRFALRRLLAEPFGAVLAVREAEPSLVDGTDLPTLRIGGLDAESATTLLGALPPPVADRLYRATAGNPLALTELARDPTRRARAEMDTPIPVSALLARAFLRRARGLDAVARRLLLVAAAGDIGDVVTLAHAARLLDLDLASLDRVAATGLVRIEDGRIAFEHPLVRAAIYSEATPDEQRAAHRAVASALPDRDADRRAWHLAEATLGTDDAASSALEQAGVRARARSAYAVAAAAFERAARLAEGDDRRCQLMCAAAGAAWLAGQADVALDVLAEARPLAGDDAHVVEIDGLRGQIAVRRGPVMAGHAILVGAAERVAPTAPEVAIALLAEAVGACFYSGDVAAMTATADRVVDLLPAGPSRRSQFLAAMASGMAEVIAGDAKAGIVSIRTAMAITMEDKDIRTDSQMLPWVVMAPLWLRETGSPAALIPEAIETARSRAALGVLPVLLNLVAREHAMSDAWDLADVEYDEALRLSRESGQQVAVAAALAGLAWLDARRGREEACRRRAREALDVSTRIGVGLFEVWALRALGDLELGASRPAAAIVRLEACTERLGALGIRDADLSPAAELVDAYLRVGRTADAQAQADALAAAAQEKGQPWTLARAARCRALLAPETGFVDAFEDATELHLQTPDLFELGVTRVAYGGRLRRARHRRAARVQLRAALDIFDRLGALSWREMTRVELLATGETARERGASAVDTLTRQERHIAQVLAEGRTIRETAAALFLSPKTVEYHLRNVYAKLGVNTRSDLVSALAATTSKVG